MNSLLFPTKNGACLDQQTDRQADEDTTDQTLSLWSSTV